MRGACVFFSAAFSVACGPQPQTENCARYVECQAAYDDAADLEPIDTSAYADDGSCWSTPEFAARCDEECADAVDSLRTAAAVSDLQVEACEPTE